MISSYEFIICMPELKLRNRGKHTLILVSHTNQVNLKQDIIYSGTSDSGPSEIGTHYNRPLYKGHRSRSQKFDFPIVLIHFEPLKEDNLSTKDTAAEFILSPTCPLFGGSTVQCFQSRE